MNAITKNEMRVMDGSGDTKIVWSSDNADEVAAARKMFDDLRKKGFSAFSVKKDGGQKATIKEFDPDLEALIMVPPIVGG